MDRERVGFNMREFSHGYASLLYITNVLFVFQTNYIV